MRLHLVLHHLGSVCKLLNVIARPARENAGLGRSNLRFAIQVGDCADEVHQTQKPLLRNSPPFVTARRAFFARRSSLHVGEGDCFARKGCSLAMTEGLKYHCENRSSVRSNPPAGEKFKYGKEIASAKPGILPGRTRSDIRQIAYSPSSFR